MSGDDTASSGEAVVDADEAAAHDQAVALAAARRPLFDDGIQELLRAIARWRIRHPEASIEDIRDVVRVTLGAELHPNQLSYTREGVRETQEVLVVEIPADEPGTIGRIVGIITSTGDSILVPGNP